MCPVCTKYLDVRIGEKTPSHLSVMYEKAENHGPHSLSIQPREFPPRGQR